MEVLIGQNTVKQDISLLTATQLADYHLAVTALQLDGSEVF